MTTEQKFIEQDTTKTKNMQLICLWPSSNNKDLKDLTAYYLDNYNAVIHQTKELSISFPEFCQLIYELYQSEPWMKRGNKMNVSSLLRKATWCYSKKNPITMILLSLASPHSILLLKEDIRKQAGTGKHSIHTIEDTQEAILIWDAYTTDSPNFPLANLYKKDIKWNLLRFFSLLRITLFRLIGYIEE